MAIKKWTPPKLTPTFEKTEKQKNKLPEVKNSEQQKIKKPEIKEKENKVEKVLRLSNDELIALAIRDILKREELGEQIH